MQIFKDFPQYTLIEKLDDGVLNYFEKNRAPKTVSSARPIMPPKYWIYLYDENVKYVTINKTGFLKYTCKKFNGDGTTNIEKNSKDKQMQVSLHLKGSEYEFQNQYIAFIFGFFKFIYVYRLWEMLIIKVGLLKNKKLASTLEDRYSLLEKIFNYHDAHRDKMDIILHNKFYITEFIMFVLSTKNYHLVYDFKKRINPYLLALSADNIIGIDREYITINEQFWAEYVQLKPKRFNVINLIKLSFKVIIGVAALAGSIAAVLSYLKDA